MHDCSFLEISTCMTGVPDNPPQGLLPDPQRMLDRPNDLFAQRFASHLIGGGANVDVVCTLNTCN
jgi:hypothetical protein